MGGRQEGRHAVSKVRRAVTMEIAIKDSKRSNTAVIFERMKTVSGVITEMEWLLVVGQ